MNKKAGNKGSKQTSDKVSKIASKALRGKRLTKAEIKSLGGSALSQDETRGTRKKKK